jgi:hypothetical protein
MRRIVKYLFIILLGVTLNSSAQEKKIEDVLRQYGLKIIHEEKNPESAEYIRKISFTEFLNECKQASKKKGSYILENCEIYYSLEDSVFLSIEESEYFRGDQDTSIVFTDTLYFSDTVRISNCKFPGGIRTVIKNWRLTTLIFEDISSDTFRPILIDDVIISKALKLKFSEIVVKNSTVNKIEISDLSEEKDDEIQRERHYSLENNKITSVECSNIAHLNLSRNYISFLQITGKNEFVRIKRNVFGVSMKNISRMNQIGKDRFSLYINSGISIGNSYKRTKIDDLRIYGNTTEIAPLLKKDSLLRIIKNYSSYSKNHRSRVMGKTYSKYDFNITNWYGPDSLITNRQLAILEKRYDSLNIIYHRSPSLKIRLSDFTSVSIDSVQAGVIEFSENTIEKSLTLNNIFADTIFKLSKNTLPQDMGKIGLDKTVFNNLGMTHSANFITKNWHGDEEYQDIQEHILNNSYANKMDELIIQVRKLITILSAQGSATKKAAIFKLKTIETNMRMHEYYTDPNVNNWFNWKGYEFLRWYSDYGTNPFKALAYCFWAMLYFALFYFFFYSDWDKIDRGFLIKRFNSVMDYFTTEKRIEDFYSTTHDKEMTTFTKFKNTLDKNKVYMPAMLASLAKPIYQLSLLRYRLLNFSYKKAEFMAGRKWVDLEKKDRYWIGTLTFFLTLTYIIYLIFIRALNSIVLSINAFSTLGFGQIPVRGFTKYVAIIEGFIGWFLLSVFIVSLLSQMMSV